MLEKALNKILHFYAPFFISPLARKIARGKNVDAEWSNHSDTGFLLAILREILLLFFGVENLLFIVDRSNNELIIVVRIVYFEKEIFRTKNLILSIFVWKILRSFYKSYTSIVKLLKTFYIILALIHLEVQNSAQFRRISESSCSMKFSCRIFFYSFIFTIAAEIISGMK